MRNLSCAVLFFAMSTVGHSSLVNGSFETPAVSPQMFSSSGLTGWTSNGELGVWNVPHSNFYTLEAPDGNQIGYMNATAAAQQSTNPLVVGVNTVSCFAIRRDNTFAGSFILELWAGGTVAGGVVTGGQKLAESSYVHTLFSPNTLSLISASFNAPSGHPRLGQLITVRIFKTGGIQANFDDVRVNDSQVNPTSFAIISGIPFGGNLASLAALDANAVFILNDEAVSTANIEFTSTSPVTTPTSVRINAATSATRNDLSQFTDYFNYSSNLWQNVHFRTSSLATSFYTANIASPVTAVQTGTKQVKARIRFIPTSDLEAADGWSEAVDLFGWRIQ